MNSISTSLAKQYAGAINIQWLRLSGERHSGDCRKLIVFCKNLQKVYD